MSSIVIAGDTSGSVTLQAPAVSGSTVITLPSTSTTLVSSQWTTSGANIFYNTGSVGVGAAPDSTFYVGGGALGTVRFFYNGTSVNYNDVDLQIWRSASASEYMRLNSVGLGIGTSSPSTKLAVAGGISGTGGLNISGGGWGVLPYVANSLVIDNNGGEARFFATGANATTDGSFLFYTSQTDGGANLRATIDSSGNLLVGTTSAVPGSPTRGNFYNAGSASAVVGIQNARNVSGDIVNGWFIGSNCNNTSSYFLQCGVSGVANVFYIYGNGNVQNTNNSYGAISDVKLKENIVDASPKLADLMQVKVRNYNLIGSTTKQIGVVAQELETIFPAMVDETPDRDEDNNVLETTTKSVKYSVFVPMLIKAIQEQQALITTLTDRISVLENK